MVKAPSNILTAWNGNDSVTLSSVLSNICQKAGMVPTSIVTSAVNQPLRGYVVSRRMAAREALEPLLGYIGRLQVTMR